MIFSCGYRQANKCAHNFNPSAGFGCTPSQKRETKPRRLVSQGCDLAQSFNVKYCNFVYENHLGNIELYGYMKIAMLFHKIFHSAALLGHAK